MLSNEWFWTLGGPAAKRPAPTVSMWSTASGSKPSKKIAADAEVQVDIADPCETSEDFTRKVRVLGPISLTLC